jgi:hypothetical protein
MYLVSFMCRTKHPDGSGPALFFEKSPRKSPPDLQKSLKPNLVLESGSTSTYTIQTVIGDCVGITCCYKL